MADEEGTTPFPDIFHPTKGFDFQKKAWSKKFSALRAGTCLPDQYPKARDAPAVKCDSLSVQGGQELIEGVCGKLSDREVGLIVREAFPLCSKKRLGVARAYHYVGL